MSQAGDHEHEYILGTDEEELARLRVQHEVWAEEADALWRRAGLATGDVVLDLGCGPGYTALDLARIVGAGGRVIASDISARFIAFLRAECDRQGLTTVEPRLGAAEDLDLPSGALDAAYARWLLCWLPDPGPLLARVAHGLKPGGVVVLQEYLDWGAMKMVPPSAPFERIVEACLRSWIEGGVAIDVGERIPTLAAACGLQVEWMRPIARMGDPESPEWRWLSGFFRSYLPRLVERGLLDDAALAEHRRAWDERAAGRRSFICTPTMVDVILRKPQGSV